MLKLGRMTSIAIVVIFFGSTAFADFSMDELVEATKVALKGFKTDHPDHVEHFTGYKSWKSEDDSKVKVYVTHDGMSMDFNYLCHKHETGIECHVQ
jgi:hypothetical protein